MSKYNCRFCGKEFEDGTDVQEIISHSENCMMKCNMKDEDAIRSVTRAKIKDLVELIKGRYAFILYADGTFKQINGHDFLMEEQETINDLMRESKSDLANEIIRIRQLIKVDKNE